MHIMSRPVIASTQGLPQFGIKWPWQDGQTDELTQRQIENMHHAQQTQQKRAAAIQAVLSRQYTDQLKGSDILLIMYDFMLNNPSKSSPTTHCFLQNDVLKRFPHKTRFIISKALKDFVDLGLLGDTKERSASLFSTEQGQEQYTILCEAAGEEAIEKWVRKQGLIARATWDIDWLETNYEESDIEPQLVLKAIQRETIDASWTFEVEQYLKAKEPNKALKTIANRLVAQHYFREEQRQTVGIVVKELFQRTLLCPTPDGPLYQTGNLLTPYGLTLLKIITEE